MDASLENDFPESVTRKEDRRGQSYQLTPDELEDFLDRGGLPLRDRVLFWTAYFTGSRISEVLALNWANLLGNEIYYPKEHAKTKIERRIKVNSDLVALFGELKSSLTPAQQAPEQPIFLNKHGRRLGRRGVDFNLNKYATEWSDRGEAHGISTHSFRRSFIHNAEKQGRTSAEIARVTGHILTDSYQRYT